jgi:hypothetical protein
MNSAGDFVVGWLSEGGVVPGVGVAYARRYNADLTDPGDGISGPFRIDTSGRTGPQEAPSVGIDDAGPCVLRMDDAARGVYHDQLAGPGFVQSGGEAFQVNSTVGTNAAPALAVDADGDVVVVWSVTASDGGGTNLHSARLQPGVWPSALNVVVNTAAVQNPGPAAVASDDDGDFIVVYAAGGEGVDGAPAPTSTHADTPPATRPSACRRRG